MKITSKLILIGILLVTALFFTSSILFLGQRGFVIHFRTLLTILITVISLILTVQGIFALTWILYAWNNPESVKDHKSPRKIAPPKFSFTALIPARHEEKVIKDTIRAVSGIDYPEKLKETLILCREDDEKTIAKAQEAIREMGQRNIRLVIFDSFPINKPHSLNQGLREAKNEVTAIFDAEDEPHSNLYKIVNTVLSGGKVDIVQSGVQLMNYRSHWFSALNVMEYFFWFKSGLHFFSGIGKITPLGGNTVFFKRKWLEKVGGWDENCLTEDADIGFRLTLAGAKTKVIYDEQHTTREETPSSISCFIKQRTRWNQGFLQIFLKGDWMRLPSLRQKLTAVYILLSPEIQTVLLLYLPFGIWVAITQKLPVVVSLFSFVPFYLFVLQVVALIVGIYEFTKAYQLRFPFWMPLKILVVFYPYVFLLMIASFRAFSRVVFGNNGWEKTLHINAHREMATILFTPDYAR